MPLGKTPCTVRVEGLKHLPSGGSGDTNSPDLTTGLCVVHSCRHCPHLSADGSLGRYFHQVKTDPLVGKTVPATVLPTQSLAKHATRFKSGTHLSEGSFITVVAFTICL